MNEVEARKHIDAVTKSEGPVSAWAQKRNISPSYIYDVVRGARPPSARILEMCGLVRVVEYHEAQPCSD